jgi:glucokinase
LKIYFPIIFDLHTESLYFNHLKTTIIIFNKGTIVHQNSIIGIDMGGTKILACVINSKEGIIARVKKATDPLASSEKYIKQLRKVVFEAMEIAEISEQNIKAVCLGIPGSVNPLKGKIGIAPNIGMENIILKKELEKELPFPVLVENDVNLGALGIKNYGVGKKSKNMLSVFVGTGIGGGLVLDEKIYRGSNFVAGEIGHMLVDKNGPTCGCGNDGCFEAVASRSAIVKNIEADIKSGKKSILSAMVADGERIKSKSLASAVKKGDKVVTRHIKYACEIIGGVLASIANLLNVDMIVLGGGLIEALGEYMLPEINKSFNKHVMNDSAKGLQILESELGDDAAIYGGISLAEEFLDIKV